MLGLVGMLALGAAASAQDIAVEEGQDANQRVLAVVGTGEVQVVPDEAVVHLGVTTQEATAREAYAAAAKEMTKVVDALGQKVAARDIRTSGVSLQPRMEVSPGGEARLVGYNASATLSINVDQPEQAGAVLDAAVQAGATDVRGVEYRIEDPEAARAEALDEAVANARATAEMVAEKLGVQLGEAISVEVRDESGGRPPGPIFYARADADEGAAMPVLPGEQTWQSQVVVRFRLE